MMYAFNWLEFIYSLYYLRLGLKNCIKLMITKRDIVIIFHAILMFGVGVLGLTWLPYSYWPYYIYIELLIMIQWFLLDVCIVSVLEHRLNGDTTSNNETYVLDIIADQMNISKRMLQVLYNGAIIISTMIIVYNYRNSPTVVAAGGLVLGGFASLAHKIKMN